jgi:hypothetical protein
MTTIKVLKEEAITIIFGNCLVFNEAMSIECSNMPKVDEATTKIADIINPGSKLEFIQSFVIISKVTEENIPILTRIKEAFRNISALSKSRS